MKSKLPHHLPLTLGAAIRSRRKDLRLSQEGLGFRSGLHRTYVADLERGARNPSLMSIAKIAKALKMSLSRKESLCHQWSGGHPENGVQRAMETDGTTQVVLMGFLGDIESRRTNSALGATEIAPPIPFW